MNELDSEGKRTPGTPGMEKCAPAADIWRGWTETKKALLQTYYRSGFPANDQQYCLAGLTRYAESWDDLHAQRAIPLVCLDRAAASEVWYHHYRSREFRRPCAALSACWQALVAERPERIFDQFGKMKEAQKRKAKALGESNTQGGATII